MTRILFVCMGNICRSPLAEGVFRQLAEAHAGLELEIDSAGTHGYHAGDPPDDRAIAAARRRGVDISKLRARKVQDQDFRQFDLIVAMDRQNFRVLSQQFPRYSDRVRLLMDYAGERKADVPDPYYGGMEGFEHALDLIERGAKGLLDSLSEPDRPRWRPLEF